MNFLESLGFILVFAIGVVFILWATGALNIEVSFKKDKP